MVDAYLTLLKTYRDTFTALGCISIVTDAPTSRFQYHVLTIAWFQIRTYNQLF